MSNRFAFIVWIIFKASLNSITADEFFGVRYSLIKDKSDSIQRYEICKVATQTNLVTSGSCLEDGKLFCECRCNTSASSLISKDENSCQCPEFYYPNAKTIIWSTLTVSKGEEDGEEITSNEEIDANNITKANETESQTSDEDKSVFNLFDYIRNKSGRSFKAETEDYGEEENEPPCTLYFKINCHKLQSEYCSFDERTMKENHWANFELEDTNGQRVFSLKIRKGCHVTRVVKKSICPSLAESTIYRESTNLEDAYSVTVAKYFCRCGPLGEDFSADYHRKIVGISVTYSILLGGPLLIILTILSLSLKQLRNNQRRQDGEKILVLGSSSFYTGMSLISSKSCLWKSCPHGLQLISEEALGRGFFGDVWKAKDLEDKVAIKRIYMFRALHYFKWNVSRLLREIEHLSQIQNEHVIKFHRYWIEGPYGLVEDIDQLSILDWTSTSAEYFLFLQMELCDYTLEKWLEDKENGQLSQDNDKEIQNICLQIALGLEAIHAANIIHRDLKPNNIMCKNSVDGDCIWKIGDLGLSRKVDSNQDQERQNSAIDKDSSFSQVGCASYRSPEMVCGKDYTNLTDVFSLGLVFWEVLEAKRAKPFWEKTELFDKIRFCTSSSSGDLFELLFSGGNDENSWSCASPLQQLVVGMVELDPKKRLDAATVVTKLQRMEV